MANKGIKGITIEIGGDTRGLESALKDVNKQSKDLQGELKDVERALKFDPGNVELVRQKQELLTASIQSTSEKLGTLRTAQAQVEAQFQRGDIGVEQYRAFQRELQSTEGEMNRLQGQLDSLGAEQDRLAQTTRQLGTFFEATGTDVEQFSGTLGTRLTQAIRDGSASADQMERALRLMGRQALGASTDIDQMREALRTADDGANLDQIRRDLAGITQEANQAGDAVNGFGDDLTGVVAGLAAGVGIAGIVSKAFDVSSLNTEIEISMNLNEEDTAAVRQSIMQVTAAIGDEEAAYEGVRRQMTLNKDASVETNQEIIMGAATISKAYKEVDFKELIQESHEIGAELKISQEEAMGLVNSLLGIGFPPEQLDIIAEYGSQLVMAGYNAEQVQAIMAAGVETGTWNIDILMDGLKEGRIVAAEFGQGIDKAMQDAIKGTNLSEQQLVSWGKAVASGGQDGVTAMQEMNRALSLIDDDTKRNEIGVKMYGTLWEEQGGKVSQTIQGMNEHIKTAAQNTEELNSDMATLESDPAYQLSLALGSIKESLAPLLTAVAEFVGEIAKWVSENTELISAIVAIAATVGILAGGFIALMPAIGGLVTAWPVLAAIIGALISPIGLVVAAIAGIGVALVAAYQNSETFRENVKSVFQAIKDVVVTVFETVATFIGEKIAQIKKFWDENGTQILQAAENVFNGIMAVIEFVMPAVKFIIETVWTAIKQVIDGALNIIMGLVKVFSGIFTGDFSKMWEGVKQIFSGAIKLVVGWISLTFVGGIRTLLTSLGKNGLSLMKGMWDNIFGVFKSIGGSVRNFTDDMLNKVIGFFRTFVIKIGTKMTEVKTKIVSIWEESMTFLKNINLIQVGKDIINGLIKGIGSMASSVTDKVAEIANSIPNWAKKVLGIHSPSRVMAEVGKWTGKGLAVGIDGTKSVVQKSIEALGGMIIDVAQHHIDEEKKIRAKSKAEITKIEKRSAEDILKVQRTAAQKKRKLTADEVLKIQRIKEDSVKKIADIEKKATKESVELISKNQKGMLEGIKLFISDKQSLEEMNLVQEAALWEKSVTLFEEGTKERVEAQKAYRNAVEAVNKEVIAINQDYQSQMQKISDDLIKQENDLTKAYEDAYSSRVNSLMSFAGTFDAFNIEIKSSGYDLLNNLQSQVDGFKLWQVEFAKLSGRGVDAGLLDEISGLGVKALPELLALNQLTDEQLTRYSALYQEKAALARQQAEMELAGMKEDTARQIEALRATANQKLDQIQIDWALKIKNLTSTTATELSSLKKVGADAGQGLLNGLASMEGPLITKATEIANAIRLAIQSALDIHSPSRVMKGFGINIGEGLIVGMDEMISKVASSSARLSDAVQNAQASLSGSAAKSANNQSNYQTTTSTVDNSKHIKPTYNIYTSESPEKVIKREMRKWVLGI